MKVAFITTDSREHYKDYRASIPTFGMAPQALLQGFSAIPELEIHVVSCAQQEMRSPEKLAPNIFFHSLFVPKIGWMRTGFQGCIRAVRKKLREIQPDLVHGQGTERECAICAVSSGFPNVLTIHGNMAHLARVLRAPIGGYNWLAGHLETFTLKRTSGVLCNSTHTERLVKPRARRTWLVPNPLRQEFFAPPPRALKKAKCVLVNVGVISPNKRQLELLDVVRGLRRKNLNFEFVFVGFAPLADPYVAAFFEKIKPLEQAGLARHIGLQPAGELISLFDESSALIHCPLEESFGLVVAEALARDLKLFSVNVGGISNIAAGVSDAQLFQANDWSGLTVAIGDWIERGYPRSDGASSLMRARYHPRDIARAHLRIYEQVSRSAGGR